ncbi:hypothetical protein FOMPIDRAFT_124195 [Fomitopsis schrenkii]|uniref:Uncharacterized protein n=1 Tax=Fomitopsis schrenkii TaxID=2126942 RepID=S8E3V4_FOMSC|nr:hypothetical protein FOMPIDRAFT_124195 [Fomitopsis schrenkii]
MLSFTLVVSAILYAHRELLRNSFRKLTNVHVSSIQDAHAGTSLFIPGFEPQPVTANLIGSQNGVATYVIAPGGSSVGKYAYGFAGPATLVAGPSTAALTYFDENLGLANYENCNVADGIAVCEDVGIAMGSRGTTVTTTVTQTVELFAVQGGASATGVDAITTSPVPTGEVTSLHFSSSGDDGDTANAGSTQRSGATPTGSVTTETTWSGFSKVVTPTRGASESESSTTSSGGAPTTSGAARFQTSTLLTVVAAGLVGVIVTLA